MPSGKAITIELWADYQALRRQGISMYEASKKCNISYHACRDAESDKAPRNYIAAQEALGKSIQPQVPQYEGLPDEAQAAYDNIEIFAKRYFGIILQPWQIEATERIMALMETEYEEYCVINAPPGTGKSTFFAKVLPAWATVRNRAIRGMIGSSTQRLAEWYCRRLRAELDRAHPVKAELNDVRLNLAIDAEATLQEDFGMFKPDSSEIWRAEAFTVLQKDDTPLSQKEPTWSAFGMDSGFLGGRFDLVIWDDVYDPRKMRSAEAREDMRRWWDEVAETRLEPGGLLVLQGQRMSADDIYRYALDKVAPPDEMELEEDEFETEDAPEEWRKYHHLKYQAHHEELCQGDHKPDAAPWPEGCLLYPRRLPWRRLRHVKAQTPDRFEVLYQQSDVNPSNVLVDPLWVSGGEGTDGVFHPGCWDENRDLWELPENISSELHVMASADPSPSQFWALQCWAYAPETEFRYLLESYRRKMDAPSFLDWSHERQSFSGVAEDWWQISNNLGHPITHWIIEANAAQKFILQYDHFRRWAALRNVQLVPHYTHSKNKGDPKYGVQMLAPLWRVGRVRLPGKQNTEARPHSMLLVNEVTRWNPEGTGARTDDCVMAQWFLEHNLEKLYIPTMINNRQWRPSWMAGDDEPALR
ncbi:MAG: hypothetical protein CMB22_00340 [Euryarchaeota archaeon]|nr:hypothetical protein [Euryarchaeota archaeon]|tara:strand:+ start:1866 stop:3794 length:1929 start_codon:yes stop_codon:yes gene_type:complete